MAKSETDPTNATPAGDSPNAGDNNEGTVDMAEYKKATPRWERIWRHSFTQMMLLSMQAFCGPAMSDAIQGLGGGGLATPQTSNTATAIKYAMLALVCFFVANWYIALPIPTTQATPRGHPLNPLNSRMKLESLYFVAHGEDRYCDGDEARNREAEAELRPFSEMALRYCDDRDD